DLGFEPGGLPLTQDPSALLFHVKQRNPLVFGMSAAPASTRPPDPKDPEPLSDSRRAIIDHASPKPDLVRPGLADKRPDKRRWCAGPNHAGARRSGAAAGPRRPQQRVPRGLRRCEEPRSGILRSDADRQRRSLRPA